MKLFKAGRQGTGYRKLKIFSIKRLGCDMYLLWYPKDSYVPMHIDPVTDKRHYRLNIVLKRAIVGGHFEVSNTIKQIGEWLYLFRPDEEIHGVSRVAYGSRLVLSIGWVKKS